MKKVIEEHLLIHENAMGFLPKIDFSDTFSTTNHFNNIEEIANLVFNTSPKWIEVLFSIRNKVVGVLGLKTKIPSDYNEDFRVGGYIKFFKIVFIANDKIVLGLNDSHLNFRVIVSKDSSEKYNVKVTTLVHYNNIKGKIYMAFIEPFHKLVVKRMVKNAYSEKLND